MRRFVLAAAAATIAFIWWYRCSLRKGGEMTRSPQWEPGTDPPPVEGEETTPFPLPVVTDDDEDNLDNQVTLLRLELHALQGQIAALVEGQATAQLKVRVDRIEEEVNSLSRRVNARATTTRMGQLTREVRELSERFEELLEREHEPAMSNDTIRHNDDDQIIDQPDNGMRPVYWDEMDDLLGRQTERLGQVFVTRPEHDETRELLNQAARTIHQTVERVDNHETRLDHHDGLFENVNGQLEDIVSLTRANAEQIGQLGQKIEEGDNAVREEAQQRDEEIDREARERDEEIREEIQESHGRTGRAIAYGAAVLGVLVLLGLGLGIAAWLMDFGWTGDSINWIWILPVFMAVVGTAAAIAVAAAVLNSSGS